MIRTDISDVKDAAHARNKTRSKLFSSKIPNRILIYLNGIDLIII